MTKMLTQLNCKACSGDAKKLSDDHAAKLLEQLPDWKIADGKLKRTFKFKNYYESMAFVNATAWISHHEDHHPDMEVGYNRVTMYYITHSAGGLTENDFICAAKMDALLPVPQV